MSENLAIEEFRRVSHDTLVKIKNYNPSQIRLCVFCGYRHDKKLVCKGRKEYSEFMKEVRASLKRQG